MSRGTEKKSKLEESRPDCISSFNREPRPRRSVTCRTHRFDQYCRKKVTHCQFPGPGRSALCAGRPLFNLSAEPRTIWVSRTDIDAAGTNGSDLGAEERAPIARLANLDAWRDAHTATRICCKQQVYRSRSDRTKQFQYAPPLRSLLPQDVPYRRLARPRNNGWEA
jgi:hypothetical protein